MLKKLLATISTIIYFAVTSGIIINIHYCMNRFDSAQFYATGTELCGRCGMHTDNSNGCCHDEVKIVKLNDDHNISQLVYEIKGPESLPVNISDLISSVHIQKVPKNDFQNHSPPLLSGPDTYLQNCVFRI